MSKTPEVTESTDSQITTLDDPIEAPKPAAKKTAKSKAADANRLTGANMDAELSGKMVMLTIHPTSNPGGRKAMFVGLNGYAYQIPRGTPWKVPAEVADVVANAITTTYEGGAVVENPREPFTIVPL